MEKALTFPTNKFLVGCVPLVPGLDPSSSPVPNGVNPENLPPAPPSDGAGDARFALPAGVPAPFALSTAAACMGTGEMLPASGVANTPAPPSAPAVAATIVNGTPPIPTRPYPAPANAISSPNLSGRTSSVRVCHVYPLNMSIARPASSPDASRTVPYPRGRLSGPSETSARRTVPARRKRSLRSCQRTRYGSWVYALEIRWLVLDGKREAKPVILRQARGKRSLRIGSLVTELVRLHPPISSD